MSVILWKAEAVSLKAGRNPKLGPSAFSVRVWFANWKIQSQPESRRLFYLVGMFTAPSLGDRFSVALRNCSKEARGAVRLHTSLKQREQADWASSAGVKLGNLAVCVGRGRPLGSLHWVLVRLSCLGPILFPCSPCFLHSPSSSAVTVQEAASAGSQLGEPSSHLEARNRWWLWHVLFINMAGDTFISQILDLWVLFS